MASGGGVAQTGGSEAAGCTGGTVSAGGAVAIGTCAAENLSALLRIP